MHSDGLPPKSRSVPPQSQEFGPPTERAPETVLATLLCKRNPTPSPQSFPPKLRLLRTIPQVSYQKNPQRPPSQRWISHHPNCHLRRSPGREHISPGREHISPGREHISQMPTTSPDNWRDSPVSVTQQSALRPHQWTQPNNCCFGSSGQPSPSSSSGYISRL